MLGSVADIVVADAAGELVGVRSSLGAPLHATSADQDRAIHALLRRVFARMFILFLLEGRRVRPLVDDVLVVGMVSTRASRSLDAPRAGARG
jgi:hypothetical protein